MLGSMPRFVALLRGINVGGKNMIPMADLRRCIADLSFEEVSSYIQSGNVIFSAPKGGKAEILSRIQTALSTRFGFAGPVALRSRAQMRRIVRNAPPGYGEEPGAYRYDVIFLLPSLRVKTVAAAVRPREGVDSISPGPGVLYCRCLTEKAGMSRLRLLSALPIYQKMTVRNWRTTTRLLALMEGER